MPGALTKEQIEQDPRQYQPSAGPWSPAHSYDDGSDKYTNVNLGIKSFWDHGDNWKSIFCMVKKICK